MTDHEDRDKTSVARANEPRLSRRGVLRAAGNAAAMVAFPFVGTTPISAAAEVAQDFDVPEGGEKTAADYPISEIMTRLSNYISQARDQVLPDEVLEKAKWALLDTFAAIVSGSQLPAGRAAIKFARSYGGKPVSTVIGDETLCGPIEAALLNGVMGHADETDDYGRAVHPGANTVPAALALGEQFGISGAHFLRAMTVGYDIGARVMVAAGVQMNFRVPTNSMGGNFAATAAAACAASQTAQQTRRAVAYAAQQDSGIDDFRRDLVHIEKAFMNSGMGARNGVTSALLVLAGFNGVNDIMGGPVSFFTRYAETARPEQLIEKLGEQYYVAHPNFKHWPVGAPVQVPIDSLQAMLKRQAIDPNQVREVIVRYGGGPGSITDNGGSPDINVQQAVALMLIDKKLTFKSIHDYARMKDPAIVRLRSITKVIPLTSGFGGNDAARPPAIEIALTDGTHLTQDVLSAGVPGTVSDPYTREWVVGKARSLMTPVLGAAHTTELVDRVLKLEDTKNIRELRPLLQQRYTDGPPRLSDWPMA